MKNYYRHFIADAVEKFADAHVQKYVAPAFDGDPEAAFSLVVGLDNPKRGEVAVAMWRAKVKREAFRVYFSAAWEHDHRFVIHAANTRRCLAAMFRYAQFPIPDELPDVVNVWRGTSKLNFKEAREGYSWTTDRDVACWFAMRFSDSNGSPLLLAAEVFKTDIALFHNERSECEVVLMKPPSCVVEGCLDEWETRSLQHDKAIKARNQAFSIANMPARATAGSSFELVGRP